MARGHVDIFRNESFCGACNQEESPEVPACARPEDSKFLLQCEQCPASYHYCCAGYYDSKDGPQRGQRWLCWRCSHNAPRGFQRNWIAPITAASPGNMVYISEEPGATVFRAATVISTHGTYIAVQFQCNTAQEPQIIARESARVWHGSLSRLVWEEKKCQTTGEQVFTPKSREYCPRTFKQLAEQHGVPVPEHLVDPQPLVTARSSAPQPNMGMGQSAVASTSQPSRRSTRAGQNAVIHQVSSEDADLFEAKGQQWLEAVRSFGESIKERVLINMPEFMALRRDLYVHSYAVWVVVMTWGGEEVVCENKLWSALAGVFDAPMTMTNRAQKMKQVWTQFRLARLTKSDAQSFSEKLEVPPIDGDLLFAKSHPIAQQWPGCKRTQLPEGGAVGRASNRGTSMAGGNSTAQGRNGVASGRGASRGRGKGRGGGGQRGRKRMRSASDSDHDRSVEPESSPEPEEDEEEDELEQEITAPDNSPPRPAKPATKKQQVGQVRKQHVRRTESGQTELSEDDEDVGAARRRNKGPASPRNSADSQDPEAAAGTMLVAEGASRLRRMPLSALPPKMPPGLDLPEGAISSEFARQLRLGDYMIRLDSSCIHTSLLPRGCALDLAKKGLNGESPRIQFVSTEKDFLGGWWDATLRGARTGSVLEGGARFLVEENYPGDPDDPFPQTWVPLVYYGPQPYPFQTPQVMLRPVPDWKPATSKEAALKVQLGNLVEAVEVPEEQEDTVFWRGCVHELKPDGQVVVRLLVAPYGNAGVSTDPEEQESNYQTHPPERLRQAPLDDLMGMVREPSDDPDKGEIRAVATTDQMELQVLQHTRLIVGRYAGGKGVVAVEAHATFKTAQAAHPDDQDLAKVIKNRKSSTQGTRKRSLSAAISAAYQARVDGKPAISTAVRVSSGANGSHVGAQNETANGSRCQRVGRVVTAHGRGSDAASEILEAQLSGAAVSPLQSHRTHSSDGGDGWAHRSSAELQQIGMQQLVRQHSAHEGRMSDSAALDSYRSSGRLGMHSVMQVAGSGSTAAYPGAPPCSSMLPSYGSVPQQSGGMYSNDGTDWELSALAQMTGAHGTGMQYGGSPSPQQLMNGGHVQNYMNSHADLGRESLPQWGEQQHGQLPQHIMQDMMPGQGTFPGARGPHG